MPDSNTIVTSEGYFSRIAGSIKGIGVGLLLFIVAFPLLFWNEGRAVRRHKTLQTGAKSVVSVSADKVDPANQDKLVHFTGKTVTADVLNDMMFQVSANAIKLVRKVEMFQWVESSSTKTEKKVGGSEQKTTTYTYATQWAANAIDSSQFNTQQGHQNPPMPFKEESFSARNVTVGAFSIPESMISSISGTQKLTFDEAAAAPVLASFPNAYRLIDGSGYYLAAANAQGIPTGCAPRVANVGQTVEAVVNAVVANTKETVTQAAAQTGTQVATAVTGTSATRAPVVGDMRVTFLIVPQQTDVSIIAKQMGNSLAAFTTPTGSIQMLSSGVRSAEEMFQNAEKGNKMTTWLLRLIGFLVMFGGLRMVLGRLDVLADVLPFLGSIMRIGTGLVAFLIAAPCSLITVAVAWIAYRPVMAIILLVIAGGLVFLLFKKRQARHQPATA